MSGGKLDYDVLNVTKCLSEHPSSEIAIRTYVGQGALKIRISRFLIECNLDPTCIPIHLAV